MKKNIIILLTLLSVTTPCAAADGSWTTTSLTLTGILCIALVGFFAYKTAKLFKDWIKNGQPRGSFWYRILGKFYDWGHSRETAKAALRDPAEIKTLVAIEILLGAIMFAIPFFIHKGILLFIPATILIGCAFFALMTVKTSHTGSRMTAAYIMPLQIFAFIRLIISLILAIALLIVAIFSSAFSGSSSGTSSTTSNQFNSGTSKSTDKEYHGYKGIPVDKSPKKHPYTVRYRYKSGSALHDDKQIMYFEKQPTIADIKKYIKDMGWPIDVDKIDIYHLEFGTGMNYGPNLL